MATTTRKRPIYYPESDGKPMGETDWHRQAIMRLIDLLTLRYQGLNTYVSGDILMYYVEGNPKKFVVPDVLVVKKHRTQNRRTYRIWDEGRVPDVIIEVTSKKTRKRDEFEKPELYRQLGVRELFLFDPLMEYLDPPLMGFRLTDGRYQQLRFDETGALLSEELGLHLRIEDGTLQLIEVSTGERLLDRSELSLRMRQRAEQATERASLAAARAAEETRRADLAEQRAAALEAELERLRKQQ